MRTTPRLCSLDSLMALPLTRQVSTDTEVRRWFALRLSNLDASIADMPGRVRCLVPRQRPDALPPWLMGMAFDWRLRLGLDVPANAWNTTAFAGWRLAFGHPALEPPMGGFSRDPITALLEHAIRHGGEMAGSHRDELRLARISVVLARYESWYRGGVRSDDRLFDLGPSPDLETLIRLCPAPAAEEIARLVAVARCGLAPLFPADDVETNPVFDAHGVPADGDLVIDGLLLDLKTVTRPQIQLEWLWQMIGYVLLDGGRRSLSSVGIYLTRHGWLGSWPIEDLLHRLSGVTMTVQEARQEFAAVIRRDVGSRRRIGDAPGMELATSMTLSDSSGSDVTHALGFRPPSRGRDWRMHV